MPLSDTDRKLIELMVRDVLATLQPVMDRIAKITEDTVRKNTVLAETCIRLHEENVELRRAALGSSSRTMQ
jgi:hypothetical protein